MIIPTHWSALMGGVEYQVKCLIEKLTSLHRFDIHYLTKRVDCSFRPRDYKIVPIGRAEGKFSGLFFVDTFNLLKQLNEIKPDVIFQHDGCAYTGIAAHYARKNNIHMVWHIASDADLLPSMKGRHPFTFIDTKFLEYGIRHCPCITTQTHRQAHLLKRYYRRTSSAVIPNFHPSPQERIEKGSPVEIVWVANFKFLKQPECFIRLASDLTGIRKDLHCTMIGAPSRSAPAWQKSLERKMARVPHLTYHGALPVEKVNAILAKAHIFVNTSTYEGFPNTFIQAWMRKVPVVSLCVNPDGVFEEQKIGFHAGTYDKLLKVVTELVANAALREGMGERAFEYAQRKHSEGNAMLMMDVLDNGHQA